ncbi:HAD family hydrolase [Cohnella abietis]|uniref:Phosphatase n=1 Tax=Cohnella abietis TaxID=2507935 RepID=A0A3T1DBG7_9BACL|nr:HAD family hydrolase [Cohnella abietis]BBI35476.1 phosphatase [Cohnella abietis]
MPELNINKVSYEITGILFDKDGTLLDFVSMWGNWSEYMIKSFRSRLAELGLELPKMESSFWGTIHGSDGTINDYDRNGPLAMGTMEELFALLIWQGYQLGLSWDKSKVLVQLCRLAADEELERVRPARPISGIKELLAACHEQGIPLGVVTADETGAAEKHLEWLGIRHYFSVVVGTDQVERGKPFPDMMELACRKLSIDVQGAVVVGDTNGDMRMGKSAGARLCIGLDRSDAEAAGEGTFQDADIIIGAYEELQPGGRPK